MEEGDPSAIHHNVAMDADAGKQKAADAFLAKLRKALQLELVEGLPSPVYGFDPNGWILYRVDGLSRVLGAAEYVAVKRETGEVRFLGSLGE